MTRLFGCIVLLAWCLFACSGGGGKPVVSSPVPQAPAPTPAPIDAAPATPVPPVQQKSVALQTTPQAPPSGREALRWQQALEDQTLCAYRDYLSDFPDGLHASAARAALAALEQTLANAEAQAREPASGPFDLRPQGDPIGEILARERRSRYARYAQDLRACVKRATLARPEPSGDSGYSSFRLSRYSCIGAQ